ncbi:hypothetical protein C5O80_32625 [Burkholderia sp. SRS-46]|nr:hypothetical protein C5O80_32625 [Burkholderia sp. SRS-46]
MRPSLFSLNPKDVRYGNGQYLSDIVPGTMTPAQLSRAFVNNPFQGGAIHELRSNMSLDLTLCKVDVGSLLFRITRLLT